MGATSSAPGLQKKRFAAYLDGLATAAGHADRKIPLKNYCTGRCCCQGSAIAWSPGSHVWLPRMYDACISR